jgi:hypothetical protein
MIMEKTLVLLPEVLNTAMQLFPIGIDAEGSSASGLKKQK